MPWKPAIIAAEAGTQKFPFCVTIGTRLHSNLVGSGDTAVASPAERIELSATIRPSPTAWIGRYRVSNLVVLIPMLADGRSDVVLQVEGAGESILKYLGIAMLTDPLKMLIGSIGFA